MANREIKVEKKIKKRRVTVYFGLSPEGYETLVRMYSYKCDELDRAVAVKGVVIKSQGSRGDGVISFSRFMEHVVGEYIEHTPEGMRYRERMDREHREALARARRERIERAEREGGDFGDHW